MQLYGVVKNKKMCPITPTCNTSVVVTATTLTLFIANTNETTKKVGGEGRANTCRRLYEGTRFYHHSYLASVSYDEATKMSTACTNNLQQLLDHVCNFINVRQQ